MLVSAVLLLVEARVRTDALLLDEDLTLRLSSRELAAPRIGEATIRVAWAGICGSDLHVLRTGAWVSYWPATLGHEVVGVVVACPGDEVRPGTMVVVDSRVTCGRCSSCVRSAGTCENISWRGESCPGGFARHLVAPVTSLIACPEDMESAIAVLAEPLAVAVHAVNNLSVAPDDALLVGYGPVGALVHLELSRRWPQLPVTVTEPDHERRALAAAFGAQRSLDGLDALDVSDRFTLVVDGAGFPGSLGRCCAHAAMGGTVLTVALSFDAEPIVPAVLVERSLTLIGSLGFEHELPEAVEILASDPDRYRPLVTEAILLEEAPERLAGLLASPSPGKAVIRPWQE